MAAEQQQQQQQRVLVKAWVDLVFELWDIAVALLHTCILGFKP